MNGKTLPCYFLILFFLAVSVVSCDIFKRNELPPSYHNGVVVTAHPEASAVGLKILKDGGNAVDAAVAVQFALAVVYPNAGNIGGGGFMVCRNADGSFASLDFREVAPVAAKMDMYLDDEGNPITDLSLRGQLASGVPGVVDGMVKAHERYGKLEWTQLLQPAILLAQQGFPITTRQAQELNGRKESFEKHNPAGTALVKAGEWAEGDTLVQPELAHTLSLIGQHGRAGFYEGEVANRIVDEMARGNGIISHADLKNYEAKWREPVVSTYRGHRIISMPPSSSGGIALISMLKSVEAYPLSKWGFQSDSTMRVMIEAERRVYADRATHLGDPDYYEVPQAMLIDSGYNAERMRNINFKHASFSSDIYAGNLLRIESEETTHFSIIDEENNAVSITTTINGSYGSHVVVDGAGFLLNNEMDDFSVKPGTPNMYGLIGGKANAIEPGKRMLSSMTPTIMEKDGKLFMVVGTPGGATIMTSVFQTILNVVDFDMNMQQAVNAPRFHHQWLPDEVLVEKDAVEDRIRHSLTTTGYKLVDRNSIGRVDAILVLPDGSLQGGADPRGDDVALGY
ncbi:gamma-glutamyltransferase [Parapedobacter tibetensis]|uniref:gamma-glutamyltransferase n=1 Tax=Parapedobacter tibetensis TaxID=2972951 RepID=UPI00214D37F2|nr:gamma-glutamyltransferase [Parapedobacter tibetensis]